MGKPERQDSFEAVYENNFSVIYRLGYRLLGNSEQALDLAQEVFLRLYQRLNGSSPVLDVRSWLYRTASNLSYDWLRRKSRFQKICANHFERPGQDVEQELIKAEENQAMRAALEELSSRDRILLTLYQDELSYEEISRAMGLRRSSVGTFISRAIKSLAKELEKGEKP